MTAPGRFANRPTSFYDDAGVDERFADAGRRDPEPDPLAVQDAGRDAQVDGEKAGQIADAGALGAPVAPDFAPAAAFRAGRVSGPG